MAAPKPASPWERHGAILQLDAQVPGKIRTSRTHLLGEQRCAGASRISATALPVTYRVAFRNGNINRTSAHVLLPEALFHGTMHARCTHCLKAYWTTERHALLSEAARGRQLLVSCVLQVHDTEGTNERRALCGVALSDFSLPLLSS